MTSLCISALQSKVEGLEQAIEANDSVGGCEKKIRELETQKRQLLRQVQLNEVPRSFRLLIAWCFFLFCFAD
jgi:hypothetical protein